jgi:hypothetical protein
MNPEGLMKTKSRIAKGDPALQPALEKLRGEAETALAAGPFSVMDKKLVPPSGDKHDYLSIGPYWWPDPEKKDGLPYLRRDGETNPQRNDDSTDARSLSQMLSNVETLALGYCLTGKEPYAGQAARLLRVWFLDPATWMNPNLEYGQAIPGRVEGRGIGLIDTWRFATMLDAVTLLASSPSWTAQDQAEMVAWFDAYLAWMRTSKNGQDEDAQENNHGTFYDVQAARYALFVGKQDLAREVLERSKQRRIATQIEPDGRQPHELARTKSFSYSAFNLKAFFALAAMGERLGVDLWHYETHDGRGIRKALDFLAPYADPARPWPYQQIGSGASYRLDLAPLLRQGARAYGDARYEGLLQKLPASDVAAHRIQLLYPQ